MAAQAGGRPAVDPTPRRPLRWVVAFALGGLACAAGLADEPGPSSSGYVPKDSVGTSSSSGHVSEESVGTPSSSSAGAVSEVSGYPGPAIGPGPQFWAIEDINTEGGEARAVGSSDDSVGTSLSEDSSGALSFSSTEVVSEVSGPPSLAIEDESDVNTEGGEARARGTSDDSVGSPSSSSEDSVGTPSSSSTGADSELSGYPGPEIGPGPQFLAIENGPDVNTEEGEARAVGTSDERHGPSTFALFPEIVSTITSLIIRVRHVVATLYSAGPPRQHVPQSDSEEEQDQRTYEEVPESIKLRSEAAACLQGQFDQLDPPLRGVAVAHLEHQLCLSRISDHRVSGDIAALARCEDMIATAMQTCLSSRRQGLAEGGTAASISQCDASTVFRQFDAATFFASEHCQVSLMSIAQHTVTMNELTDMDVDVAPVVVAKLEEEACLEDTAALPGISKTYHFCGFVDAAHQDCLRSLRVRGANEGMCDAESAGGDVQLDGRTALTAIVKYGWCRSFFEGEQVSVCSKHLSAVDGVVDGVAAVMYKYSQSIGYEAKFIHWSYADACYFTSKYSRVQVLNSCAWAGKEIQIEDGPCEENPFTFEASYGMGQLPGCNWRVGTARVD